MSRHVVVVKSKGHRYVRVVESYRNPDGAPRSRIVENLGRLDRLEAREADFLAKLRARVAREVESAVDSAPRGGRAFDAASAGCGAARFKLGAAVVRRVWKEALHLPQLFRYLQGKRRIEYSYDKAAFLLCSQRILHEGSKKQAFEERASSIISFADLRDNNVVYRVLDRLQEDKKAIVRHLNRALDKRFERSVSAIFYDVPMPAFESRSASKMMLGLVMDEFGIPVDYELTGGGTAEWEALCPVIQRMRRAHELKRIVVVEEGGAHSNETLSGLAALGGEFVLVQGIECCTPGERRLLEVKTFLREGKCAAATRRWISTGCGARTGRTAVGTSAGSLRIQPPAPNGTTRRWIGRPRGRGGAPPDGQRRAPRRGT